MGLTAPGEGERAIHEGWVERDGKLPVNVSGGLKAKGHPVGATGVSMHVMSAMQLSGTAPGALPPPPNSEVPLPRVAEEDRAVRIFAQGEWHDAPVIAAEAVVM